MAEYAGWRNAPKMGPARGVKMQLAKPLHPKRDASALPAFRSPTQEDTTQLASARPHEHHPLQRLAVTTHKLGRDGTGRFCCRPAALARRTVRPARNESVRARPWPMQPTLSKALQSPANV